MSNEVCFVGERFSAFFTFEAVDIDVVDEIMISQVDVVSEFCSAF